MAPRDMKEAQSTSNAQFGKRRARSLSESALNVETVMTKARRASSYLWTLLHAQRCTIPATRCPHRGCCDAKRMLLHLKLCTAESGAPCPSRHPGCDQARKLLDHFQQCRTNKRRQAGLPQSQRNPKGCLICTLVARQARSLLEGTKPSHASIAKKRYTTPAISSFLVAAAQSLPALPETKINDEIGMATEPEKPMDNTRHIVSSFTMTSDNQVEEKHGRGDEMESENLQAANQSTTKQFASPFNFSGDNSTMEASMPPPIPRISHRRRKRAESLDERSSFSSTNLGRNRSQSFSDTTEENDSLDNMELLATEALAFLSSQKRGRSASCHIVSPSNEGPEIGCETILEEMSTVSTAGGSLNIHASGTY